MAIRGERRKGREKELSNEEWRDKSTSVCMLVIVKLINKVDV